MIGEVAAEARKRAPLVAMVSELEEARGELAWVAEWEHDEQRYKVRVGGVWIQSVMPKVPPFKTHPDTFRCSARLLPPFLIDADLLPLPLPCSSGP